MAKRTIHMLIDDLDGGEAEETITFALDGVQYEIDLSKKNAGKMRDSMLRFIEAGTRIGRGGSAGPIRRDVRRGTTPAANRDQNRAIREWAQARGISVSDRGRIKQEIVDQFNAEAGR